MRLFTQKGTAGAVEGHNTEERQFRFLGLVWGEERQFRFWALVWGKTSIHGSSAFGG